MKAHRATYNEAPLPLSLSLAQKPSLQLDELKAPCRMKAARGLQSMGGGRTTVSGGTVLRSQATPGYDGDTNRHGEPHGEGRRTFASGHVYEGSWKDGQCHGFGRFAYPDGQVFEGQWSNGRRNGKGKLAMPNGEMISGVWDHGKHGSPVGHHCQNGEGEPHLGPEVLSCVAHQRSAKKKRSHWRSKGE